MKQDYKVEIKSGEYGTVVSVMGELRLHCDPFSVEMNRVLALKPDLLIFDLSGLTFISSLGMGCLISSIKSVKRRNGRGSLAAAQPSVKEALQRARLLETFPYFDTLDEAIRAHTPAKS